MPNELKNHSKSLSYWLRHEPQKAGINLDQQGWAPTDAILEALGKRGLATDLDLLRRVVTENDKQRFEFNDDETQIRARQGHSVGVEGAWKKANPPAKLYHGTVEKFLPAIEQEGLTKQKRHHVHLSPDIETASKVGQRRGKPVILVIDAAKMAETGIEFALSANGVWLVEQVPPQFLRRLTL
ncbi:RNA 2'-phosphotransferase [uncultured Erythrobacter sp.]|uniref:RNA 2'-phosphotransferase n=1 Tax=uncultured Erythrobacter sp. TaxID=263913 RepID=UPI0026254B07|nr:RNA 2'-phosphotransferase [uncultured Erythrobacter sp.]